MAHLQRRLLTAAMGGLEEEKAAYFADIAERVDEDPRTDRAPNLVYLVLADTVKDLPVYLDKKELLNRLYRFVDAHSDRLRGLIYDPAFIAGRVSLKAVTGVFVAEVVDATLSHYEDGDIDSGDPHLHRMTFDGLSGEESGATDGGDLDFPYIDEDALEDD